jgi:hypothetical protein
MQQMQTASPAADKDELGRMALHRTTLEVPNLQFPQAVAGTFNIIHILLELDVDLFAAQMIK